MNTTEARAVFDKAAAAETDPDKRARIELCREYFTNPRFRRYVQDTVWAQLQEGRQ